MNNTISPLDGRYQNETVSLVHYFSEFAFFSYRWEVEIKYLELLSRLGIAPRLATKKITFSEADFLKIKSYEKTLHHDVKALEYVLKEKTQNEFVHFGLTSEDTNNLALGLALRDFLQKDYLPKISKVISVLKKMSLDYQDMVMLARTHGQPAVPTTLGKELAVFAYRVNRIVASLKNFRFFGKLNGAVGNYNALVFAYPKIDWLKKSREFVEKLGLEFNQLTTQIESGDKLVEFFDKVALINTILISFCQDMWRYISDGYFVQKRNEKEAGSSTMPQKVNPINFENAEGNLQLANSLFKLFGDKLPISRLQRDLSGSTIKRNIGVALGHTLLAYQSILKGLEKVTPNQKVLRESLFSDWSILAEAAQIYLKTQGYQDSYDLIKKNFRGVKMNGTDFENTVINLPIKESEKSYLSKLRPDSYTGLAKKLCRHL